MAFKMKGSPMARNFGAPFNKAPGKDHKGEDHSHALADIGRDYTQKELEELREMGMSSQDTGVQTEGEKKAEEIKKSVKEANK